MSKRVAIIGGTGNVNVNILMAAIAATGSQVVVDCQLTRHKKHFNSNIRPKKKNRVCQRIRKQWYTVDSPEVKRMSQ